MCVCVGGGGGGVVVGGGPPRARAGIPPAARVWAPREQGRGCPLQLV